MLKKVRRYLRNPYYALGDDMMRVCPKLMSDKYYIKVIWKQIMGYPLDLHHPKTFNEKLQWMKLYDRNPLYTDLVDKLKVKEWVAERIGAEHVIPTLAVYDSVDEIDISQLPNQFVLKCNHDSGGVVICSDKQNFDFELAKRKVNKSFCHNFYWDFREWPYKNVDRKIFAESFLTDKKAQKPLNCNTKCAFEGLKDYKFFCFDGVPRIMYIANDRAEYATTDFFDMEGHLLPVFMKDSPSSIPPLLPSHFEEMKTFAEVLSAGLRQVRVDFYEADDMVYFGEMTFFHSAGFSEVHPKEWNMRMGNWIRLDY